MGDALISGASTRREHVADGIPCVHLRFLVEVPSRPALPLAGSLKVVSIPLEGVPFIIDRRSCEFRQLFFPFR